MGEVPTRSLAEDPFSRQTWKALQKCGPFFVFSSRKVDQVLNNTLNKDGFMVDFVELQARV